MSVARLSAKNHPIYVYNILWTYTKIRENLYYPIYQENLSELEPQTRICFLIRLLYVPI
jgi:hypothetical protein